MNLLFRSSAKATSGVLMSGTKIKSKRFLFEIQKSLVQLLSSRK